MNEIELRKTAKKRAAFKVHAFLYIIIIVFLGIINLATSSHYLWFFWPALGWGLGVVIHGFVTYAGSFKKLEESEYRKLKSKSV